MNGGEREITVGDELQRRPNPRLARARRSVPSKEVGMHRDLEPHIPTSPARPLVGVEVLAGDR
jgi:hypothetical protein